MKGAPQVIEAFKGELDKQKGWDEVARFWKPPAADAGPDRLFPRRFEGSERISNDTQADIPELDIHASGHRATYQSPPGKMELCVYRASNREREAIYRRALERINPPRDEKVGVGPGRTPGGQGQPALRYVFGSAESPRILYRLGVSDKNGLLWWDREWLFVVRTEGGGDAAEWFKKYLLALSSPEAAEGKSSR
jgi:hypothetical protein